MCSPKSFAVEYILSFFRRLTISYVVWRKNSQYTGSIVSIKFFSDIKAAELLHCLLRTRERNYPVLSSGSS
jgi:hypothetical protein